MSRKRKITRNLISFWAIFAVLVTNVYVFNAPASAGVDNSYGGPSWNQIKDYNSAKNYVNNLCNDGGYPGTIALAMYPSDVSFNDATGSMTYNAQLVWRSCPGKGQDGSRAFAVTGYPSSTSGQPATCPDAGIYAVPHTYDCVKYTNSDLGHLKGYATLNCWPNTGYDCVTGGGDPNGLFRRSIEVIDKEPTYDGNNPNTWTVRGLDGQVPDWSNRTLSSGSWSFYRSSAFCTYYKSGNNGSSNYTPYGNCVDVTINVSWSRYNYSLVPTITAPGDNDTVDSGSGPYAVKGNIHNNGPTGSKPNTQWQLTQIVYSPTVDSISNRSGGDSDKDPCGYFTGGDCKKLDSGSDPESYASGGDKQHNKDADITDYAVGTKVCFALSVKPYTHSNENWRHATLSCLIVSKSPKAQVLGGDLIVGRGSSTNTARTANVTSSISRTASNGYFGSWAEYGVISSGIVTGMASGSGYVGGASGSVLCGKLSILTFTNSNSSGVCSESAIGGYVSKTTAPGIAARFPVTDTTVKLTGSADILGDSLSGLYTSLDSTLNLRSSGAIPAGRWVVINAPNTTVTIGSDIRYTTDPLTSIGQIPQVVIIAKNIIIADKDVGKPGDPAISQVDSWLVAVGSGSEGRINTCGAGTVSESTALTSKVCDAKLTVNGPITANRLILRRTAGAGTGSNAGDPAEVFNLRSDAYIWATSYSPGTGRLPTVMTKEIPPRF